MPESRGRRRAVLAAARQAWEQGMPGTAWDILADAGMESFWPTFRQTGLATARQRFEQAMDQYRPARPGGTSE